LASASVPASARSSASQGVDPASIAEAQVLGLELRAVPGPGDAFRGAAPVGGVFGDVNVPQPLGPEQK